MQELAAKKTCKENVIVPWYVMTSGPTRKPTQEFFEKNNYFGLEKENVTFFEQGVLPCLSNEGKIILESKSKVTIRSPDKFLIWTVGLMFCRLLSHRTETAGSTVPWLQMCSQT